MIAIGITIAQIKMLNRIIIATVLGFKTKWIAISKEAVKSKMLYRIEPITLMNFVHEVCSLKITMPQNKSDAPNPNRRNAGSKKVRLG